MIHEYATTLKAFSPDARRYLVVTCLIGVAIAFHQLIFNLYLLSLGHDQAFIGMLASLPPFVAAGLAVPVGIAIPKLGYRTSLLIGVSLIAIALLGWTAFLPSPALIGSTVLWGAGTSILLVTAAPLMASVTEKPERMHLFSVQFSLNTLVGVAANLLGGNLPRLLALGLGRPVEGTTAYRAVFLVSILLVVAAMAPAARLRAIRSRGRVSLRLASLIDHRRVLAELVAVQLAVALGAGMLMPFVNVFYKLRFDLPDPALGALFSISSLTVGLSSLIAAPLAGRIGSVRTIVATQALSLPFLGAMGCASGVALSASGFLVRTALMNMSTPIFSAFSMRLVPEPLRPMTASLLMVSWNGGWGLSAWLSGRLQVANGFSAPFLITELLYFTAIAMTFLLLRNAEDRCRSSVVP